MRKFSYILTLLYSVTKIKYFFLERSRPQLRVETICPDPVVAISERTVRTLTPCKNFFIKFQVRKTIHFAIMQVTLLNFNTTTHLQKIKNYQFHKFTVNFLHCDMVLKQITSRIESFFNFKYK